VTVAVRVGIGALLLAMLWSFTPPAHPVFELCGFHWLTGRPCPLCGLTRAMFALGKGHWMEAIHFNVLSPVGLVMVISLFWNNALRGRIWSVGIAAFAVYGVVRAVASS
jgi:hypothetical protein